MKIADRIHLVGSGALGINQSNEYDCNVYLINAGDCLLLVDCGAGVDTDSIIDQIRGDGFDPLQIKFIFITHAHADHSGGAYRLQQITDAAIMCSEDTGKILGEADENAISLMKAKEVGVYPEDYVYRGCMASVKLEDRNELEIGNISLQFISTPGHSRDSYSCYVPQIGALFSGDVVFEGGRIAALPTPDFSIWELSNSITKLSELTVHGLFPGHLSPILRNGQGVIRKVKQSFESMIFPQSIV